MYYLRERQQGYTLITLSILFIVIGFFALLLFKIAPIYMNHSKVLNTLAAIEQTKDIENASSRRIRSIIDARFNINYVEHLHWRDVEVINRDKYLKIIIEYEVVEQIFGNASVLVEFYEELELGEGVEKN